MIYLISIVAIWLGALWSFIAAMKAKMLWQSGQLTLFWKVNIAPLAFVGILLDFAFNVLFGTLMFREVPREWLFSTRVQRHVDNAHGWRFRLAAWWRKNLNAIDAAHIK